MNLEQAKTQAAQVQQESAKRVAERQEATAADRILLIFDWPHGNYNAGDCAGFTLENAERILRTQYPDDGVWRPVAHEATKAELAARAEQAKPAPPVPQRLVYFDHHCGRYNPGDKASFPETEAKLYVEGVKDARGRMTQAPVAHYHEEPKGEPVPRRKAG